MPRLPTVSGKQAVVAFGQVGYAFRRRCGSHIVLVKSGVKFHLSVPDHDELAKGTLRGLIRDAGLTTEEFIDLLEK